MLVCAPDKCPLCGCDRKHLTLSTEFDRGTPMGMLQPIDSVRHQCAKCGQVWYSSVTIHQPKEA